MIGTALPVHATGNGGQVIILVVHQINVGIAGNRCPDILDLAAKVTPLSEDFRTFLNLAWLSAESTEPLFLGLK